MKFTIALAASVLSLSTLAVQAALPAAEPYSVTVQFADLDLDREAGITKLYFRIKAAASRVCDQQANERLVAKQTYSVCVERAVATATARINRPMLSEYVAKRGVKLSKKASQVAVR